MVFLDLEKAFNKVPHELIWHALRSRGVPEVYIYWVELLYRDASSTVCTLIGTSPPFTIRVGVHQGSALFPLLFVLCMDVVTADLQRPHPWTLLYGDDVFLSDEDQGDVQGQTQQWKTRLGNNGMRLNTKQTKYMESGPQIDGSITVDEEDLKKVTEFKYLGSVISSDGDLLPDVLARITAAWMKWSGHWSPVRSPNATSPQVQSISDRCPPSCLVQIGVLASRCQARAGSPCDGDGHAAVEPRPDKMGPRHEHRRPEDHGNRANNRQDVGSSATLVWSCGPKHRRFCSQDIHANQSLRKADMWETKETLDG
ncbi:hypothetical protein QTP70_006105 [Hemibagrus guttatus]|uniref:ribonuclease H n=1 Tax=Hemibagrus guttatus TaxID=175788 RepID=A0AAE0UM09_9TELE|nr:hypothetical protein QTP70_006105 [Hemibagrus guttatus]KAK3527773.1 hypothetical protein QTP86_006524 [Hemibagrus guttatus]